MLLKAASQLQAVRDSWNGPDQAMWDALSFNRRLWSIFMGDAQAKDNPQPLDVRNTVTNIGVFVMSQTVQMQINPDPTRLTSLIDINRHLAAGLAGQN